MPDSDADAKPETGDSRSGGTISDVHEKSDSDVDTKRQK